MSERQQCSVCGKNLRKGSPFKTCGIHRTLDERRAAWAVSKAKSTAKKRGGSASDDSVLSRMGFGADEAPPATKRKAKKLTAPKPPPVAWQPQFRALASALGLDPEAMIERFCREWVESTTSRALAPAPQLQLPEFTITAPRAEG